MGLTLSGGTHEAYNPDNSPYGVQKNSQSINVLRTAQSIPYDIVKSQVFMRFLQEVGESSLRLIFAFCAAFCAWVNFASKMRPGPESNWLIEVLQTPVFPLHHPAEPLYFNTWPGVRVTLPATTCSAAT